MSLKLITAPAAEPITIAEAKAHLRVDHSDEDSMITALIVAARMNAENRLSRALITQTWELILDAFPDVEIRLDKPSAIAITSVKYLDSAGNEQTIAAENYTLDAEMLPGFVLPAYGYEWPETIDAANAVRVRFTAGYGDAASVPMPIKQWMLINIGTLYANREGMVPGQAIEIPRNFTDAMLDPYQWSFI